MFHVEQFLRGEILCQFQDPKKQITVNDVTVVKFEHLYPYFVIRNDGTNTIFASTSNAECTEGADGVISIPTGTTVNLMNYGYIDGNRTLYINGTGVAMVTGWNNKQLCY